MTTSTQAEKCRVIAEWLGWKLLRHAGSRTVFADDDVACLEPIAQTYEIDVWHIPGCRCPPQVLEGDCIGTKLPDFYTSEDASASLLDTLLERDRKCADPLDMIVGNLFINLACQKADRKTAIAEAAYQLALAEQTIKTRASRALTDEGCR